MPALMFQGLSSNAGKSVLCSALCRILLQDGFKVSPFKAQNMSLNSYVTKDGKEMGRAQMVQAVACGLEPDVRMNPILIKPSGETGSQIIVRGNPVGTLNWGSYSDRKEEMLSVVREDYDSLAATCDVVVLEGAGSPAEVNLKDKDIVNMKMARYADAKVLLAGDIDRGGVFASFIGTMMILDPWERELVSGYVINRFRGDKSLLEDALTYLENETEKPVLGVVPFIGDLGIPDEDSVSFKQANSHVVDIDDNKVQIAIIDLPHISNFTDFDPFTIEPDVSVTIVRSRNDLIDPDIIIIPGTKNVMGDLNYLAKTGLEQRIQECSIEKKTSIVGICGGFQMLGLEVKDPFGIESSAGDEIPGLGLLPVTTKLEKPKTLTNTEAIHSPSKIRVRGYEIHHGTTQTTGLEPAVVRQDGEVIGTSSDDGRIFGTYLHGFFDNDEMRRWFIDAAREKKGLKPIGRVVAKYDIEPALERLADIVRSSMDIGTIYKLMGLK